MKFPLVFVLVYVFRYFTSSCFFFFTDARSLDTFAICILLFLSLSDGLLPSPFSPTLSSHLTDSPLPFFSFLPSFFPRSVRRKSASLHPLPLSFFSPFFADIFAVWDYAKIILESPHCCFLALPSPRVFPMRVDGQAKRAVVWRKGKEGRRQNNEEEKATRALEHTHPPPPGTRRAFD